MATSLFMDVRLEKDIIIHNIKTGDIEFPIKSCQHFRVDGQSYSFQEAQIDSSLIDKDIDDEDFDQYSQKHKTWIDVMVQL